MRILYHIVSGQTLPNYIADKKLNPDKNIFFYSEDSKSKLAYLDNVIKKPSEHILIDAWNYDNIKCKITETLLAGNGDESVLNYTCGTKVMSIAAFEVFREMKKQCVYVNTQEDTILYNSFNCENGSFSSQKLKLTGNIEDHIKLNGQNLKYRQFTETPEEERVRFFLEKNFQYYQRIVLGFAGKYDEGKDTVFEVKNGRYAGSYIKFENGTTTVLLCNNGSQVLAEQAAGSSLADFISGRWFEAACYYKLLKLNRFDQLIINAEIEKQNKSASDRYDEKNEIDILAIKGIYPFLFECKSGGVPASAIEKLTALKNTYLGRYSSLYLFTYFPLDTQNETHRLILEKINDNKIKHILFGDIARHFSSSSTDKVNLA